MISLSQVAQIKGPDDDMERTLAMLGLDKSEGTRADS